MEGGVSVRRFYQPGQHVDPVVEGRHLNGPVQVFFKSGNISETTLEPASDISGFE